MDKKLISIAKDFSKFPAGRYYDDGPFPGQKFREEFLIPAFKTSNKIVVDLDGTLGYGSSFLEEAFGGLIRVHHLTLKEIKDKLTIIGTVETYKNRAWGYIEKAEAEV